MATTTLKNVQPIRNYSIFTNLPIIKKKKNA